MSAEYVAVIPQCEECQKVWLTADEERWQAHWIDDGPVRPPRVLVPGLC